MDTYVTKILYFFKSFFKANTILEAMSPVLSLEGFMGLTPFKISSNSGKPKTLFSISYTIINVLLLGFYFYCIILVFNLGEISFVLKRSAVFVYSEMFQFYLGFLAVALIHVLKYINKNYLAIHFEITERLSEILENLGLRLNHGRLKVNFFFASILQFIFCISLLGITILSAQSFQDRERLPVLIAMFWPSFTISMAQFMSTYFVYIMWLNLRMLNELISKVFIIPHLISSDTATSNKYYNSENKYSFDSSTSKQNNVLEKLDIIWKAYANICKNANILDDYFCLILLAVITPSFINTLFNLFYSYFAIFHAFNSNYLYKHIILRVSKCLINAINMCMLAMICNVCEDKVTKKALLLKKI